MTAMEGPNQAVMSEYGHGNIPGRATGAISFLTLSVIITLAVTTATLPWGYYIIVGLFTGLIVIRTFQHPVVALSLVILGHIILIERTEEITVPEVIFGFYLFGFLAWWFFDRVVLRRERICVHPADRFLMAFLVYGFVSVLPALAIGSHLINWLREVLTVATLFLYFPFREQMKIERRRRFLVGMLGAMICAIAIKNILNYGVSALAANYLWELLGARQAASAHFFFPAFVVISSVVVHLHNQKKRLGLLVLWLVVFIALLLTFARGFWFGSAIGLLTVYMASPVPVRQRLLGYGMLLGVVGFMVTILSAGDFTGRIFESLVERFTSSGKTLSDISLRARFVESQAILGSILSSPVLGNGYGSVFSFYNILTRTTMTTVYAHNGYLFLLFKVGIVGTGLMLGYCLSVVTTAWRGRTDRYRNPSDLPMISGALGVFVGLLLITVTSNVFIEKESLLVMSMLGALVVSSVGNYPPAPRALPR